ncbi:MAG: ATP-grasp domain-containing protein [Vicinamibacterales bacterium]
MAGASTHDAGGPRVLILSATTGYQLRSFNDAATRLGITLVFATDRCHALDDPWQDRAVAVRFHEEEASVAAVVAAAAERPVAGVLAVGDRPARMAAQVSAALDLPGHPLPAVADATSKLRARRRFAAAGLAAPWFVEVPDTEAPDAFAHDPRLVFPCVVKPTTLSGSRGVIRADTAGACATAITRVRALLARPDIRALRPHGGHQVIVEGFIPGREFAIEGVLTHGRLQPLAIFGKPDPLDGPFFEETIYATPPDLDEPEQRAILTTVERAIAALGLSHGPVHAECRMDAGQVVMLEIAPRPIGGLCSRVLRFVSAASPEHEPISLEELLLRHATGEDVSGWRREPQAAAVMMIPIPRRGHLRRVEGEAAARAVPLIDDLRVTAKPDQLVEPLPEAGSYLGFIFARARSASEATLALRQAHACLSFVIETPIGVRPA